ncbi:MAG: 3'-5' exoribonuclease [Gallionella sp.]|nr:3'-5' exoribonuclease [Gallionella sp.]MDP1940756.1 3'-5' exoribonuclease [Gallionella sp.]
MEKLMLIFFDCEFSELGIDPKLISIGLISECGTHEFYTELSDTYQPADCAAFVHEAVLPHLQGGDALITMDELTLRLGNWIEGFEQSVQLATDSLSWDWPWIQELFYLPGTWPENLDGKPVSLYEIAGAQILAQGVELAFRDYVPRLRRHHALDDAKANRLAWLAANEAKANAPKRIERFVG